MKFFDEDGKYISQFKEVEVKYLEESFHPKDDLLAGITFEDLIDTVYSNEKTIDATTVRKVFRELVKLNMTDAESDLKSNLKGIIDYIIKARKDESTSNKSTFLKEAVDVKNIIDEVIGNFEEAEKSEEDKAKDAIKSLINTDWGKDNNSQGKASELFKALSFNNSDIANSFMNRINKYTSSLEKEFMK